MTRETGRRSGSTAAAAAYPSPATFLVGLFSCAAFVPGSPDNPNVSQFCDPSIDRQMRRAEAEQQSDPTGSRALWQRVDREITDAAPWVPLMATKDVNFLSKRVGNYQFSPDGDGPAHRPALGTVGQR